MLVPVSYYKNPGSSLLALTDSHRAQLCSLKINSTALPVEKKIVSPETKPEATGIYHKISSIYKKWRNTVSSLIGLSLLAVLGVMFFAGQQGLTANCIKNVIALTDAVSAISVGADLSMMLPEELLELAHEFKHFFQNSTFSGLLNIIAKALPVFFFSRCFFSKSSVKGANSKLPVANILQSQSQWQKVLKGHMPLSFLAHMGLVTAANAERSQFSTFGITHNCLEATAIWWIRSKLLREGIARIINHSNLQKYEATKFLAQHGGRLHNSLSLLALQLLPPLR